MTIGNTIKKIIINYLIPGTIIIGSFLLFYIAANLFFYVKRFYLFNLFFGVLISLIISLFVAKHKFLRAIHMLFFVFSLALLWLITTLSVIQHNPWALVYEVQSIGTAAQKIYFQPTEPANFPSKKSLFFTYINLELKSLFNSSTPINESLFGYDITFHSYQDLAVLFREIFIDQEYSILLDNNSPMIIDCGSNEGLSILYFKMMYPDSKIIGFEAHPKSFEILKKNIEGNNLSNVTLINKAVYNTEGYLTFSANNGIGGHVLQTKEEGISIAATLLSTHITVPIDLLKMDIEGAESIVIAELAQHKKLSYIKNIIMEFHSIAGEHYNNLASTLHTLEDHGFVYQIIKTDAKFRYSIIHAQQNNLFRSKIN